MRSLRKKVLPIVVLIVLLGLASSLPSSIVYASPSVLTRAFVAYRDDSGTPTTSSPKYRDWGGTGWGSEYRLATAGSPVRWVRVAYCPNATRYYEKIVVTLSDDGYLDAYVRGKTAWTQTTNIGYVGTTANAYRAFDIAYEKTTGRALVVYGQSGDPLTTTLRPNAAGTYQAWSTFGSGSAHWDRTSDQSDATGVEVTGDTTSKETEHLQDSSLTGGITLVTATMRASATGSGGGEKAAIIWKLGASEVESSAFTIGRGAFADYSDTSATDPAGGSWDWSDINSLEIGSRATSLGGGEKIEVSEYWIVVSYTGPDLAYRIWDGATWSAEAYFDDPGHTTAVVYYWIALASKPTSGANEISMIGLDGTNSDINGWVWSGTAWGNYQELTGSAATNTAECIAVSYEMQSGKAWTAYGIGSTVGFRRWTGTAWETAITPIDVGGTISWISLKSDPASDKLMLVSVDGGADLTIIYWDESSWTLNAGGFSEDSACETSASRCADFDWEPEGSKGLLTYGDSGVDDITYQTFAAATPSWGTRTTYTASGVTDQKWVQSRREPRGASPAKIMIGVLDDAYDITLLYWTGTGFAGVIDISDSTVDTYECWEVEFQINIHEAPILSVVPATQTVSAPFSIKIDITFGYDIYTWEFNLTYDTAKITATNVLGYDGDYFLNQTMATTQFNKTINDSNGWVWAYGSLVGDVQGVTGNYTLARVNFNIDATGTSTLNLHDCKLVEYDFVAKITIDYPPNYLKEVDGSVTITAVPEFPLGAAMEIALAAVVIYVWWTYRRKTKPQPC